MCGWKEPNSILCPSGLTIGSRTHHALVRRTEADAIYQKGIHRRARPVDPLTRRYEEFKSRTSAPPPKQPSVAWQDASSETRALRRAPLKNHPSSSIPSSSSMDCLVLWPGWTWQEQYVLSQMFIIPSAKVLFEPHSVCWLASMPD